MKKVFTLASLLSVLFFTQAQVCAKKLALDTTFCSAVVSKSVDASVLATRLNNDSILLVFNATGTVLQDSAKCYFHAGPEFRPSTGWQNPYTVGTWGLDNGVGVMTQISASPKIFALRINPRSYFNYSVDSCLNGIFFVLRSAHGAVSMNNGGSNYFLWTANSSTTVSTILSAAYTTNSTVTYTWNDGNTNASRTLTAAGNYTVTATGLGGVTATGFATIKQSTLKINLGPDVIRCGNPNPYIITAPTNFAEYHWFNSATSTGNTLNAFGEYDYTLRAVDSLGCSSMDTLNLKNDNTAYLAVPDTSLPCAGVPVTLDASININKFGDSITIVYDATQGISGLLGADTVYMHSAAEMVPFAGWQYTTGTWGANNGVGLMTPLGNNKWTITIHPQSYYNYPIGQNPNGLLMVFRNKTGSLTGKSTSNGDIFVALSSFPATVSAFSGVTATRKARKVNYAWNTGATTASIAVNTPGTYYVTATQGSCSKIDTVIVSANSTMAYNLGNDTLLCAGAKDTLRAGAFAHYHWSTGDTLSQIAISTAGTYKVTVTAANGCVASDSVRVSYSSHQVSLGSDITRCAVGATTLTATTGFLNYSWIGKTAATSNTYSAMNAGCYWVKATDSAGCASYDSIVLRTSAVNALVIPATVSSCPSIPVTVKAGVNIATAGDSLIITYDATQGQTGLVGANKVYMHSAPEFQPFSGWQTAYTVGTWGADNGVGKMDSLGNNKWQIKIVPQCYFGYSPDSSLNGIFLLFRNATGTQTGKDGAGNNIYIATNSPTPTTSFAGVTVSKNKPTVSYAWNTGATTDSLVITTSGTYIVTATQGTCSKSDTVVATFANGLPLAIGNDTTICSGGSVLLNAGNGYKHYAWNTGDTLQTKTVSIAGTNTVTVTDNSGCTRIGSRKISISSLAVNAGADKNLCMAAPTTLTASAGFANYTWIGKPTSTSATNLVNKEGCYSVMATDSFGCKSQSAVAVHISDVNGLNLADSITACPGNPVNLDAGVLIEKNGDSLVLIYDATQGQTGLVGSSKVYMHSAPEFAPFTGWNAAYTVGTWGADNGVGKMDSLGNNKWKISFVPQCYYGYSPDTSVNGIFITFRNANGTQTGKDATGNNIFVNLSTNPVSTTFSGLTVSKRSTGNISYLWSNGATTSSISVTTAGVYKVTATDINACTKSDSIKVIFTATGTINLGHDTSLCAATPYGLNAGAGFTHYIWSSGDTTQTKTVTTAGTYSVTGTLTGGCASTGTIHINYSGTAIHLGADLFRCNAGSSTLTAPAGFANYQWFGTGANTATYTATKEGCYWLKATDSVGCVSYDTVKVMNSVVNNLVLIDTITGCSGTVDTLNAGASLMTAGTQLEILLDATGTPLAGATKVYMHAGAEKHATQGWGITSGNWGMDDGIGQMSPNGTNKWRLVIDPKCYFGLNPDSALAGIYMVFRNTAGTLQTPVSGTNDYINLQAATPTCAATNVSVKNISTAAPTYTWSTGSNASFITVNAAGKYYVTVTEGTCSKTDSVLVIFQSSSTANAGKDTCVAAGGRLILRGNFGNASYLWSNGGTSLLDTVTAAGTYWLKVTNSAGCVSKADTVVVTNCTVSGCAGMNANFSVLSVSPNNVVTIKDLSTGTGLSYHWSFGDGVMGTDSGSTVHTYATAGTYTIRLILTSPGCAPDTFLVTKGVNTGINDIKGLAAMQAYPNPTTSQINILVEMNESQTIKLRVINMLGEEMIAKEVDLMAGKNNMALDLSSFASGLYQIELSRDAAKNSIKIIKE